MVQLQLEWPWCLLLCLPPPPLRVLSGEKQCLMNADQGPAHCSEAPGWNCHSILASALSLLQHLYLFRGTLPNHCRREFLPEVAPFLLHSMPVMTIPHLGRSLNNLPRNHFTPKIMWTALRTPGKNMISLTSKGISEL